MAKRKKTSVLVENPPSASPSRDQSEPEEESEEEVAESQDASQEEEEEQQTPHENLKNSQNPQNPKRAYDDDDDPEEEDGDETDADSDDNTKSSPTASDFTVKPVLPSTKNRQGNSTDSRKSTSKRVVELRKDDGKKGSPKKKTKVTDENDEKTKRPVAYSGGSAGGNAGRVWSEDDAIAILKGMIDYQNQKGADPHADMGAFHEFVKRRFQFDVTKTQLYEKVRRLKKKFFSNLEKGQDLVFAKPFDENCFKLSKRIWGSSTGNGSGLSNGFDKDVKSSEQKTIESGNAKSSAVKSKGKDKKKKVDEVKVEDGDKMAVVKAIENDEVVEGGDEVDFSVKYPYLTESLDAKIVHMSESQRKFIKGNISFIDSEKARELDNKWKELKELELEIFYKQVDLIKEQTALAMDATKKR